MIHIIIDNLKSLAPNANVKTAMQSLLLAAVIISKL